MFPFFTPVMCKQRMPNLLLLFVRQQPLDLIQKKGVAVNHVANAAFKWQLDNGAIQEGVLVNLAVVMEDGSYQGPLCQLFVLPGSAIAASATSSVLER